MYPLADVYIEGNEMVDCLANEAKTLEPVTSYTTVFDVNGVSNQKLCSIPRKKLSLPELNYSREITTTITRIRIKHFQSMEILPDSSRSYVECSTAEGSNWIPNIILAVLPLLLPFFK
ncbi:RNase H domain-containing protein [Trichonephila clavipes]|nr:RNase H domain-containing protein [Trichonephila clavipes]